MIARDLVIAVSGKPRYLAINIILTKKLPEWNYQVNNCVIKLRDNDKTKELGAKG